MSETASLAKALAEFQGEMPTVPKKHKATVQGKDGKPGYSYTYAGLADVSAAAMPLLSKHGLSFSCVPELTDRGPVLTGVLLHESGESIRGSLPLQGSNRPQDVGSALTYARRYLFGCLTGLVTDDDDDGNLAQQAAKRQERKAERVREPQEDQWTTAPGDEKQTLPMSDKTRARMFAVFAEHGIDDATRQRTGMEAILGRPITSRGELTEGEANAVIADLRRRPKPQKAAEQ